MRKLYFVVIIAIISTFLMGCKTNLYKDVLITDKGESLEVNAERANVFPTTIHEDNSDVIENDKDVLITGEEKSQDTNREKDNVPPTSIPEDSWDVIENKQDMEWTKSLRELGKIQINIDGCKGFISIKNNVREGASYIGHMEIAFKDKETPYIIEDYDATFEKLSTFDVDNDGNKELLVLFNSHGNGGQGTHDLMIFKEEKAGIKCVNLAEKIDENKFNIDVIFTKDKKIQLLNMDGFIAYELKITNSSYDFLYNERELYLTTKGKADGIFDFTIVRWKGEERLMIYQYVYGYDHSDGIADILSIINMESIPFRIEKQWIACNYSDAVQYEK